METYGWIVQGTSEHSPYRHLHFMLSGQVGPGGTGGGGASEGPGFLM